MNLPTKEQLVQIYGESKESGKRFAQLAEHFWQHYHHDSAAYFSAPGRTEIIGNHTDHNGGKVIAASIDMDTIGAAYPNGTRVVHITSEGYAKEIVVDLADLSEFLEHSGSVGLVAGMMEGVQKAGFSVSGFDAYVSTKVIPAAGVSSSASFEMLICSIVNALFCGGSMTVTDYARIGQYAENTCWKKDSGMMDQMACAVGGAVLFDFSDRGCPKYKKMDVSFEDFGYRLVIVNTGKGHADLSDAYSGIPAEMKEAAKVLGVSLLHETTMDALLAKCGEIENDRALLRALHFFEENSRVEQAAACIEQQQWETLLALMRESGHSSWELLQNCYDIRNCKEQKVARALALTDLFLKKTGHGICRVHGGGFAGVILCVLPEEETECYVRFISEYVGRENVYPMKVRKIGAVQLSGC